MGDHEMIPGHSTNAFLESVLLWGILQYQNTKDDSQKVFKKNSGGGRGDACCLKQAECSLEIVLKHEINQKGYFKSKNDH